MKLYSIHQFYSVFGECIHQFYSVFGERTHQNQIFYNKTTINHQKTGMLSTQKEV